MTDSTPSADAPSEITRLLREWQSGDPAALGLLTPLVYQELRRIAGSYLRQERAGHTLQPTALVHEAYVRLIRQEMPDLRNRAHFLALAARAMRQILIDHARSRNAEKRGAGQAPVDLDAVQIPAGDRSASLLALDDALAELARFDERRARVLEMYYFGGMSQEEIADAVGVHFKTVARDLKLALAWLRTQLPAGRAASAG